MITVYAMSTCQDCIYLHDQLLNNPKFEVREISAHVKILKEFIRLRDTHPAFNEVRRQGLVGIPCFVKEDGSVTLVPEEVGLKGRPQE